MGTLWRYIILLAVVSSALARTRNMHYCPNGAPPKKDGTATVYCGRGSVQRCPDTHFCNIDPLDRFAVCCPKETKRALELCPKGVSPLMSDSGSGPVFCGRGPTRQNCPSSHYCNIDPVDRFAVCCPKVKTMTLELCPKGASPLKSVAGSGNVFCGRGPTRQNCPSSHYCNVDPVDRFAVCCPKMETRTLDVCPNGASPLMSVAGSGLVFCGRGPSRQNCPSSHYCNIDPADRFAVCCPKTLTTALNHVCPDGEPPLMNGKTEVFCGLSPFSQACPSSHYCNTAPDDSYAFCCPKKIKRTGTPSECPPDKPYTACKMDPCIQERRLGCPLQPKAECRANYCGGCIPEWWLDGERAYCWAF